MNSSQDGRSPSIIIRLIGTLIGVSLLVYLLSRQGWTEIAAAIHQIPLATIVLACVLMLTSRLAVSARWHALLRSSGAGISLSGATKLTFAGLFAANFLPTTIGGDVVRLAGALRGGQARLDGRHGDDRPSRAGETGRLASAGNGRRSMDDPVSGNGCRHPGHFES